MKHAHSGVRRSVGSIAALALAAGAAAVVTSPAPAQAAPTATPQAAAATVDVDNASLTWGLNGYAQQGIFGPWTFKDLTGNVTHLIESEDLLPAGATPIRNVADWTATGSLTLSDGDRLSLTGTIRTVGDRFDTDNSQGRLFTGGRGGLFTYELPPSEWSIDYDSLDQGRDNECLRRSTSRRRSSASCVRWRSCWAKAARPPKRAGGSRSASRPTIAGARNMVA